MRRPAMWTMSLVGLYLCRQEEACSLDPALLCWCLPRSDGVLCGACLNAADPCIRDTLTCALCPLCAGICFTPQ